MLLNANKLTVLPAVLLLLTTLTGCSTLGPKTSIPAAEDCRHAVEASRVVVTPERLTCIQRERKAGQWGECAEGVLRDWIAQNAPSDVLNGSSAR